jgi:hypothetical protein
MVHRFFHKILPWPIQALCSLEWASELTPEASGRSRQASGASAPQQTDLLITRYAA